MGVRFKQQTPTSTALRRAVLTVLTDDRYRVASQHLSDRMAQAPGLDGLASVIDDLAAGKPTPAS